MLTAQSPGQLRALLAHAPDDTTRANLLELLAWEYRSRNQDSSRYFAEQALELATRAVHLKVIAYSLTDLGNYYRRTGQDSLAVRYHESSLAVRQRMGSAKDLASGYNMLARAYRNIDDADRAIRHFKLGLQLAEAHHLQDLEAKLSDGLGVTYLHLDRYHLAGPLLAHALALHETLQNRREIAQSNQNIGNYHQRLGQSAKALAAFERAWACYDSLGDLEGKAEILLNQGAILYQEGRLKAANEKLTQALCLGETHGFSKMLPEVYHNLALVSMDLGNAQEAAKYHMADIRLNRSAGKNEDLATGLIALAAVPLKQNRPQAAIPMLKEARALLDSKDAYTLVIRDLLKAEAQAYAAIGDFEAAFQANTALVNWEDSISHAQHVARELADNYALMRQKNELLAKEAAVQTAKAAQAEAEVKQRGLLLLVIVLTGVAVVGFGIAFIRNQRLKIRTLQAEKVARETEAQKEAEIQEVLAAAASQAFRLRMETQERERKRIARDLHDQLGNRLAMVQVMFEGIGTVLPLLPPKIATQYQRAVTQLEAASDDVRKIAHNMHAGEIARYGLLSSIENLCLQVSQMGKVAMRFHSTGDVPKLPLELENELYAIASTLIQNVLRHANATQAQIDLSYDTAHIHLDIRDDGIGFAPTAPRGLGLQSVEDLCKRWAGEMTIHPAAPSGTLVTIQIPVPECT